MRKSVHCVRIFLLTHSVIYDIMKKIYTLTPIRQQNFMIENNEFFVYSVGANCVRPLGLQHTTTGERSSPLQITIIEFELL